ncbi:MAG: hypothetical protein Q9213_007176 [Squamulea squamosa]
MEQEQLERIATQHMTLADQYEQGTLHPDCIKLAELHSTAVDFSKAGIPIYEDQFPLGRRDTKYQPEFMAPGRKIKVEEHGIIFGREQLDLSDDDDPRKAGERPKKRCYESKKILGILYRSIDERAFFKELHERSPILKDDHQYSTNPPEYPEEIEVFIGNIICRTGYRSKRQKENTTGMKEKYDRVTQAYMAAMRDDTCSRDLDVTIREQIDDSDDWEALRRSMACLFVGIQAPGMSKRRIDGGRRDTFGWIAAAAVMRELEVYQEDRDVGPLRKALAKQTMLGV